MGPTDFLLHAMGLLAPALFLAVLLPTGTKVLLRRATPAFPWWAQGVLLLAVGAAVLAGGLWWFGRAGKRATYFTLVLALASTHWLVLRAWR